MLREPSFKLFAVNPSMLLDATSWARVANPYVFHVDVGSAVCDPFDAGASDFLNWCNDNFRGKWSWGIKLRDIHEGGHEDGDLLDVIIEVWIGIDSASDAVLARMTWLDLRSENALH